MSTPVEPAPQKPPSGHSLNSYRFHTHRIARRKPSSKVHGLYGSVCSKFKSGRNNSMLLDADIMVMGVAVRGRGLRGLRGAGDMGCHLQKFP